MKYIIGYSGGLDSSCLLHMYAQKNANHPLLAVHVNHDVSPNSEQWQKHCQQICENYGIAFKAIRVDLAEKSAQGFEAAAREARYKMFAQQMEPGDILLTAHHLDDQAETFLLQALRGAGINGLAAMPASKPFANGEHHRPLLAMTRQQLEEYAAQHHLTWVEDESNQNTIYARNYLRHKIIPLLLTHWPNAQESFVKSSAHAAEAMQLVEEIAQQDLQQCLSINNTLQLEQLSLLSRPRQKNVLRFWLKQQGKVPSTKIIKAIFTELIAATEDANPVVAWPGGNVRRFQNKLFYGVEQSDKQINDFNWDWHKPVTIAGVQYRVCESKLGIPKQFLPAQVSVRFRRQGEKLKVYGHNQRKLLKKLLQSWQVPPWQREQLPLFFIDDCLIAAPPYFQAHCKEDISSKVEIKRDTI